MPQHTPPQKDPIDALARGFRTRYLEYEELTAQLQSWVEAFPHLASLSSLGKTSEGRNIWMITVGPEPDRPRPAVWVDGNLHAGELAGSSAALAIAEDALRLHVAPDAALHELPDHVREVLRQVLFHVVPRISPDGAEAVLKTGRAVRSVPRDDRPSRNHPRWIQEDVDGDGLVLHMRVEDPAGELVESSEVPGLLLPRRLEDEGPFYKLYPEGFIEHFDGHHIPDPAFTSDNYPDLNRNFPWSWRPEPDQAGAGAYPASEPESRAVVEAAEARPYLFAWLNLHTFGGVHIRPLGHDRDSKLDPGDRALFRQIEEWAKTYTGYPMVSGFEEFTYQPEKPLHGDLSDFAFHQRGCLSFVTELWDLFARLGIERKSPFVHHYAHLTREEMIRLARFDAEQNAGRAMRPWRSFDHPQLGPVEIGGFDPRVGLWNPTYEALAEVCAGQSGLWMRVAAMAPRVVIRELRAEAAGDGASVITCRVENHGYLPTHITAEAARLPWNEPLWADIETAGCELVGGAAHREVGHLEGWGSGLEAGTGAPYFQRTRGGGHARTLTWTVRGRGSVRVQVGSCRTGHVDAAIEV
jgi:hypothetical protein